MRKTIEVRFLSEWQIATGIGDGHWADSMLARDNEGLPFIPGRALKGALREGAWRLGFCRQDLAEAEKYYWGSRSDAKEANVSGRITVSSARLEPEIRGLFAAVAKEERDALVRDMTNRRIQTKLDSEGQVVNGSLRTLECGIPGIVFIATLEVDCSTQEEKWVEAYFRAVCAAVKSIGGNRSRGLGVCKVSYKGDKTQPVLPTERRISK